MKQKVYLQYLAEPEKKSANFPLFFDYTASISIRSDTVRSKGRV